MTPQELIRFENYVRTCGYSTRKEGDRYCHGVVNLLKDAWYAAQKGMVAAPDIDLPQLPHLARRQYSTYRVLHRWAQAGVR
ncbi:MAG: hypothetical protein ABWY08_10205 [Comamonas sp.]